MRKALVIGINQYPRCPLAYCENDARHVAKILERNEDNSPNFDVKLRLNVPERGTLLKMIHELFEGNEGVSLFYFAGHGSINSLGGHIVTPDYKAHSDGVSMRDLLELANQSKVPDKIIILDCCHSGAFGEFTGKNGNDVLLSEGLTILTACRDTQKAKENLGHGIFTSLLLDALNGGAADVRGVVTPGSVYSYIDQALGPWYQRPLFKTNVNKFTILREVTPRVAFEVLRKITLYFPSKDFKMPLDSSFEYTSDDANPENVKVFKDLQKMEGVGLVEPEGEDHMYWAAINKKFCKLTTLGQHYRRLVDEKRI